MLLSMLQGPLIVVQYPIIPTAYISKTLSVTEQELVIAQELSSTRFVIVNPVEYPNNAKYCNEELMTRLLMVCPCPSKVPKKKLLRSFPMGANCWEREAVKSMSASRNTVYPEYVVPLFTLLEKVMSSCAVVILSSLARALFGVSKLKRTQKGKKRRCVLRGKSFIPLLSSERDSFFLFPFFSLLFLNSLLLILRIHF